MKTEKEDKQKINEKIAKNQTNPITILRNFCYIRM
jgi:hypothetical protein